MGIWELYLLTVISNLSYSLAIILTFSLLVVFFATIFLFMPILLGDEEDSERAKFTLKGMKPIYILCVVFCLFGALLPSEKQIYLIIGGAYATNIDGIEKLPANVVKAANAFLDQYNGDDND